MKLGVIIEKAGLEILTEREIGDINISRGLSGDLLSYILSKGGDDALWITIQRHVNIIAVASSVGIPAIVLCDNIKPDRKVIDTAEENEIILLNTGRDAFSISGIICRMLDETL